MEGTAYGPQGGFRLQKSIDQRKIFGTNRASEGQPQSSNPISTRDSPTTCEPVTKARFVEQFGVEKSLDQR